MKGMISKKNMVFILAAAMVLASAVTFAMMSGGGMMGGGSMMTSSGGFGMTGGMAGGPIRWMILKVSRCRLSLRLSRNRLSKGKERRAPWTRVASAVAWTFVSLARRRLSQLSTSAGFLERPDSVGSCASWAAVAVCSVALHAPSKSSPMTSRNGQGLAIKCWSVFNHMMRCLVASLVPDHLTNDESCFLSFVVPAS